MSNLETIVNAATDEKKIGVVNKYWQLIAVVVLSIALVVVCMSYMKHMESDAAKQELQHKEDQDAIKYWRDNNVKADKLNEQAQYLNDLLRKLNDSNHVHH